jgi:catechol 2,3-dioxygenase-like lactoylglutathione lyase family enzyme
LEQLEAAMAMLRPGQPEILLWRYGKDLGCTEIAARLGVSLRTGKRKLAVARRRLQAAMKIVEKSWHDLAGSNVYISVKTMVQGPGSDRNHPPDGRSQPLPQPGSRRAVRRWIGGYLRSPMNQQVQQLVDAFETGRLSRRELVGRLTTLILAASGLAQGATTSDRQSPFQATGLDHIALRVPQVPRARDFYQQLLGMQVSRDGGENSCFLTFGNAFLAIFRGEPARMDHYCYSVDDYDVREAETKLRAEGLAPRVVGDRIYFNDPDGLVVELAAGNPR